MPPVKQEAGRIWPGVNSRSLVVTKAQPRAFEPSLFFYVALSLRERIANAASLAAIEDFAVDTSSLSSRGARGLHRTNDLASTHQRRRLNFLGRGDVRSEQVIKNWDNEEGQYRR